MNRIFVLNLTAIIFSIITTNISSQAAVLLDTMGTPGLDTRYLLGTALTQAFTVPANETWSVDSITLMLGQADEASGNLSIRDSTDTTSLATTTDSMLHSLNDFQPLQFTFASPVTLSSGDYLVRENFDPANLPAGDYWQYNDAANSLMMRIDGNVAVPEPATSALAAGLGLLAFAWWRHKTSSH